MKNFKKTLSFILALTLVCAAALIPASAASGSDSFFVKFRGYNCNATLDMDDYSATATFDATEGGGEVVPDPTCWITGSVVFAGPNSQERIEQIYARGELNCSNTVTVESVTIRANAAYYLNTVQIGTLSV